MILSNNASSEIIPVLPDEVIVDKEISIAPAAQPDPTGLEIPEDFLPDKKHEDVELRVLQKADPDRAARVMEWSKKTGYSPDTINADLDFFEKWQSLPDDRELDDIKENSPWTYQALTNPMYAALVADEYQQMGAVERKFKKLINGVKYTHRQQALADLYGKQRDADLAGKAYSGDYDDEIALAKMELGDIPRPEGGFWNKLPFATAELGSQLLFSLPEATAGAAVGSVGVGAVGAAVGSVVPGLGTAAGAGTGLLWGARLGFVGGMAKYSYDLEGNLAYGDLRILMDKNGNPIDVELAVNTSKTVGLINASLETAGDLVLVKGVLKPLGTLGAKAAARVAGKSLSSVLGKVLSKIPGTEGLSKIIQNNPAAYEGLTLRQTIKEAAKDWALTMAGENSTEYLQNVVQIGMEESAKKQSGQDFDLRSKGEVFAESLDGMMDVAAGTAGLGFLGGLGGIHRHMGRVREAADMAQAYKELGDGVKDLKLPRRDPEKAIEFLAKQTDGTPMENVYIPIDALEREAQSNDITARELLQEIGPEAEAQYEEASASGGDIEIKTSVWAVKSQLISKMSGKPLYEALAKDVKSAPDKPSLAEVEYDQTVMMEEAQKADELIKAGEAEQTDLDVAVKMWRDVIAQTPVPENMTTQDFEKQTIASAELMGRMTLVEAKKRKMDVADLAAQMPLPVVQTRLSVAKKQAFTSAQKVYASIKEILTKNEEILSAKENGGKTPVLDYLIKRGGVRVDGTSWAEETANWRKKDSSIMGLINNKSGMSMEAASTAAQEYLQQNGYGSLIGLDITDQYSPDTPDLIEAVNREMTDYKPIYKRDRYNKKINELLNVSSVQFKRLYEKEFGQKIAGGQTLKGLHYFLLREAVKDGMLPSETVLAEHRINADALTRGAFDFKAEVEKKLSSGVRYPVNDDVIARLDERLEPLRIKARFEKKEMQDISFDEVMSGMAQYFADTKKGVYATNKETGIRGGISKSSQEKIFSSQRKTPTGVGGKIGKEIAVHLKELFEKAVLVKTHSDVKEKKEYFVHRFFVPAEIDGRYFSVKISVKEFAKKRAEFSFEAYEANAERDFGIYDLNVPKEISLEDGRRGLNKTPSSDSKGQVTDGLTTKNSIADNSENFKPTLREVLQGVSDTSGPYNLAKDGRVLFQDEEGYSEQFKKDVRKALADENIPNSHILELGKLPALYVALGLPDSKLKTNKMTFKKALGQAGRNKHNVPMSVLEELPRLIADPTAVFKSSKNSQNPNGYVAVLDAVNEEGKQIIAILSPSEKTKGGFVFVPSVYDKDNFKKFVNKTADEGGILYIKEKGSDLWGTLQLRPRHIQNLIPSIRTKEDFVNPFPDDSQYFQGPSGARGSYDPAKRVITLSPDANASTLIHELAHYWLQERFDYVSAGKADEAYLADYAPLKKYLEIKDGQKELTRQQHEKFAKSFEAYLREGIAPNLELKGVFARFRHWMLRIYKDVQKQLGVELNDDIRRVFDRMLATEDAIAAAERERTYEPFSKVPGLTDEDVSRLKNWQEEAHETAVGQLMKEQMSEISEENEQKRIYAEEKTFEEVSAAFRERPEYQMAEILENHFASSDGVRSAKELAHAYHDNSLTQEERVLFCGLAELNGYKDGAEVAQLIAAAPTFDQAVNREVEKRMEKYQLLKDMKNLRQAAAEALNNEKALEVLALERELFVNRKKTASVQKALARKEAAKLFAKEFLAKKSARQAARFNPYYVAQKNAAKKAARALAKQDYENASKYKDQELLNAALASESIKIRKRYERTLEYFKFIQRKPVKLLKKEEHWLQIADLLRRLDMPRLDYELSMRLESLADWVARMRERGMDGVAIPEWILDKEHDLNYARLNIDSLQAVAAALKNINHTANFENRLFTMHRKKSIDELALQISGHLNKTISDDERAKYKDQIEPEKAEAKKGLQDYLYSITTLNTQMHKADGYHDFGLMYETFIQPTKAAADKESMHLRKFYEAYGDLIEAHYSKEELKNLFEEKRYYFELGNEATRERLLVMALNMGNETNRKRLIKNAPVGYGYKKLSSGKDNLWGEDNVLSLLRNNLTARDWDFVQGVWDLVNEPWEAVSEMHKRLAGFAPGKVEASPFAIATADGKMAELRGGYFPIKYDARGSRWAETEEYLAQPLYTESNQAWFASTKQGHTKARAKEVHQPLALNLNLVERHMTELLHDLYFRPVVVDLRRVLDNEAMRTALTGNLGRAGYNQLKSHLNMIATGGQEYSGIGVINKTVEWLRRHTTIAVLAGKLSILVENFANPWLFANAVEGFTAADALKGVGLALGDYGPGSLVRSEKTKAFRELVFEKSPMMKDKSENFDYTLRTLKKTNIFGVDSRLLEFTNAAMVATDDFFAVPMWWTAYQKFKAELELAKDPNAEQKAVDRADMLVNRVLGSGRKYDAAEIMRSRNAIIRCMTMFATFMNNEFNRWSRETGLVLKERDALRYAGFVAGRLLAWNTTSMLLAGKWPEELDPEALLKWWLKGVVDSASGMFVGLRDLLPVMVNRTLGWQGFGYRPTPISGTIEDIFIRPGESARGFLKGQRTGQDLAETVAKAASYLAPYPNQLNSLFFNAYDYVVNGMTPRVQDAYRRRPRKERNE